MTQGFCLTMKHNTNTLILKIMANMYLLASINYSRYEMFFKCFTIALQMGKINCSLKKKCIQLLCKITEKIMRKKCIVK